MLTHLGRYKLPCRTSSEPEPFLKRISQILTGLEGAVCLMDDMFFGKDKPQKGEYIGDAKVTLNCEATKTKLQFVGQVIDEQ